MVALSERSVADALQRKLGRVGFSEDDCVVTAPEDVAEAATEEIESPSLVASLGSSIHLRARQLELAHAGCTFLKIRIPDDDSKVRVLRVLSSAPLRYAVHYHRLMIEDLIERLPAASDAVKSGSLSDV